MNFPLICKSINILLGTGIATITRKLLIYSIKINEMIICNMGGNWTNKYHFGIRNERTEFEFIKSISLNIHFRKAGIHLFSPKNYE